jgi:hypothetical protein
MLTSPRPTRISSRISRTPTPSATQSPTASACSLATATAIRCALASLPSYNASIPSCPSDCVAQPVSLTPSSAARPSERRSHACANFANRVCPPAPRRGLHAAENDPSAYLGDRRLHGRSCGRDRRRRPGRSARSPAGRVYARGEPIRGADAIQQSQPVPVLQAEVEHHQGRLAHLDRPRPSPTPLAPARKPSAITLSIRKARVTGSSSTTRTSRASLTPS